MFFHSSFSPFLVMLMALSQESSFKYNAFRNYSSTFWYEKIIIRVLFLEAPYNFVWRDLLMGAQIAVACCWGWHVCGGIQQRGHSSSLQHQEEKQSRRKQHLPGWNLPPFHLFYQTRVHGSSWSNTANRWWCHPIIQFQNKETKILVWFELFV